MLERVFTLEDQLTFAKLSGDYNPIHIDPVVARRLMFGRPVLHGIHAVLWALDMWLKEKKQPISLNSMKIDFVAPIAVSETVQYKILKDGDGELKFQLVVNGSKAAIIKIEFVAGCNTYQTDIKRVNQSCPDRTECQSIAKNALSFLTGNVALHFDNALADKLFTYVKDYLPIIQVAELLAITRIVGMECPGLNALFSGMSVKFSNLLSSRADMNFKASNFDDRLSSLAINIEGPCATGKLLVFYRPSPKKQPNYLELLNRVAKNEFAGQHAVIIGGSRGLGEITTKLLAAGGAEVLFTYHRGKQDALQLVEEITLGGGIAAAMSFDVISPPGDLAFHLEKGWSPTHLYYFATPFIFEGKRGKFSPVLFNKFCNYYIEGFISTIQAFNSIGGQLKKIFYPSSIAIEEMPLDMAEYSAAKSAGEALCRFLNNTEKGTDIIFSRLPRLDTDQTASITHVKNSDPVPFMLKIIRELKDY